MGRLACFCILLGDRLAWAANKTEEVRIVLVYPCLVFDETNMFSLSWQPSPCTCMGRHGHIELTIGSCGAQPECQNGTG